MIILAAALFGCVNLSTADSSYSDHECDHIIGSCDGVYLGVPHRHTSLFELASESSIESECGSLIHDVYGCQKYKWQPREVTTIFRTIPDLKV